jgi:serine/threonine-protein kinase
VIFGRYEFIRQIGKGGMGKVYLMKRIEDNKVVAVKVLPLESVDQIQRFIREATLLRKMTSPYIVKFSHFGVLNVLGGERAYFLEMDYVPGKDLKSVIQGGRRFSEKEVLEIFIRASMGFRDAYDKEGILHRDIKLQNIMLSNKDPFVFDIDFGLAKAPTSDDLTGALLTGTPQYIAPERIVAMANPSIKVDCRADFYSIGMSMFYLAAAELPFEKSGEPLKHLHAPIPDIRTLIPNISLKTANLIKRLLAKDPNNRHQNYTELIMEMVSIRDSLPGEVKFPLI